MATLSTIERLGNFFRYFYDVDITDMTQSKVESEFNKAKQEIFSVVQKLRPYNSKFLKKFLYKLNGDPLFLLTKYEAVAKKILNSNNDSLERVLSSRNLIGLIKLLDLRNQSKELINLIQKLKKIVRDQNNIDTTKLQEVLEALDPNTINLLRSQLYSSPIITGEVLSDLASLLLFSNNEEFEILVNFLHEHFFYGRSEWSLLQNCLRLKNPTHDYNVSLFVKISQFYTPSHKDFIWLKNLNISFSQTLSLIAISNDFDLYGQAFNELNLYFDKETLTNYLEELVTNEKWIELDKILSSYNSDFFPRTIIFLAVKHDKISVFQSATKRSFTFFDPNEILNALMFNKKYSCNTNNTAAHFLALLRKTLTGHEWKKLLKITVEQFYTTGSPQYKELLKNFIDCSEYYEDIESYLNDYIKNNFQSFINDIEKLFSFIKTLINSHLWAQLGLTIGYIERNLSSFDRMKLFSFSLKTNEVRILNLLLNSWKIVDDQYLNLIVKELILRKSSPTIEAFLTWLTKKLDTTEGKERFEKICDLILQFASRSENDNLIASAEKLLTKLISYSKGIFQYKNLLEYFEAKIKSHFDFLIKNQKALFYIIDFFEKNKLTDPLTTTIDLMKKHCALFEKSDFFKQLVDEEDLPFIQKTVKMYEKIGVKLEAKVGSDWILKDLKELSSLHDLFVLKYLGAKYRYFKVGDKRKKCLILTTAVDENKAFNLKENQNFRSQRKDLLKELEEKGYTPVMHTISSYQDLAKEVKQVNDIALLIIAAHGKSTHMYLNPTNPNEDLTSENVSPNLFSNLDPNAVIILDSCLTAQDEQNGLAAIIAKLSNRVTFAARTEIDSSKGRITIDPSTSQIDWSFKGFDEANVTKVFKPKSLQNLSVKAD